MTCFKAILFDLDGTLIDSAPLVALSVQKTFEDFDLPAPAKEEVIAYMGVPIEIYFAKLGEEKFQKLDPEDVFARYRSIFKDLVEGGALYPFPGVPELLSEIKNAGIKTGIVTSKATEPAKHSCEHTGIAGLIDAFVGSDIIENYKPAPDTVFKCLDLLGLEAGPDILVVGDAEGDIGMGKSAGCTTCAVTWGAHDKARLLKQGPDFVVEDVAGLKKIVIPSECEESA